MLAPARPLRGVGRWPALTQEEALSARSSVEESSPLFPPVTRKV